MSRSKPVVIIGNEKSSIIKTRKERHDFENSNKFAALFIKLQLIPPNDDSGDNEALENASGDIAEKMFIAEARNVDTAAFDFVEE